MNWFTAGPGVGLGTELVAKLCVCVKDGGTPSVFAVGGVSWWKAPGDHMFQLHGGGCGSDQAHQGIEGC